MALANRVQARVSPQAEGWVVPVSTTRRLLLTHKDRERYVVLELGKDVLVGRALEAGFFLNNPSISRRHCILRATETGAEVEDLASRNACYLNGQRILNRTLLSDDSILQIGKISFAVRFLDAPPETTCGRCGKVVPSEALSGAPDGTPICISCAESYTPPNEDDRIVEVVGTLGYSVKKILPGIPTTLHVERTGVGKPFLIKMIDLKNTDRARVEALREEAKLLAAIDHPSLSTVHDIIELEDMLFVVTPHDSGTSLLSQVRDGGPLSPRLALEIASHCLEAVEYLGTRGVVHKEISPANVLLGAAFPKRVNVRIGNFPLARDLSELSRSFSGAGALDRLLYVAPELLTQAGTVDSRADIFGVGSVILYALTGRTPFGDMDVSAHLRCVIIGAPIEPDLTGVPNDLRSILQTFLAGDPDKRPESPEKAHALVKEALAASARKDSGMTATASGRAIEGGFDGHELIEYMQLLELNRKSGELEIWSSTLTGKLRIHEGRLDYARTTSGLDGVIAARRLISLPTGRFRFTAGEITEITKGLGMNLSALLLDIVRERDESGER
jgi:serine/threonine protein kinase